MRIRKRCAASDYLAANAKISYQQPPLKRSPMSMPSTIHSPPPLHITQTETERVEAPIVPHYNRGRRWRDLLTSLNSRDDLNQSEDPKEKDNNSKPAMTVRNPSDPRRYFGMEEQDANGSGETQEAPAKLKRRSNDGEGTTKVRRDRKVKVKIVEEERDRLRVGMSMSSSADIHEEDDDDGEVSERKMKKKKKKSLKSLHGVLDEYHHQYVESPQCSFPSTSTSTSTSTSCANANANAMAQYLL